MADGKTIITYDAADDFQTLSSEDIEVRAIGDANAGRRALFSDGAARSEQAVEYDEKRQLAIDEKENADPTAH